MEMCENFLFVVHSNHEGKELDFSEGKIMELCQNFFAVHLNHEEKDKILANGK